MQALSTQLQVRPFCVSSQRLLVLINIQHGQEPEAWLAWLRRLLRIVSGSVRRLREVEDDTAGSQGISELQLRKEQ